MGRSVTGCHGLKPGTARPKADTADQAYSSIVLERCWQIIQDRPERQHAVAMLRWQQDMKEGEIALDC